MYSLESKLLQTMITIFDNDTKLLNEWQSHSANTTHRFPFDRLHRYQSYKAHKDLMQCGPIQLRSKLFLPLDDAMRVAKKQGHHYLKVTQADKSDENGMNAFEYLDARNIQYLKIDDSTIKIPL